MWLAPTEHGQSRSRNSHDYGVVILSKSEENPSKKTTGISYRNADFKSKIWEQSYKLIYHFKGEDSTDRKFSINLNSNSSDFELVSEEIVS